MTVSVEPAGDGVVVRLAHPERANALDVQTLADLHRALKSQQRRAARFVVLAGVAPYFCSGLDRAEVPAMFRSRPRAALRIWRYQSLIRSVRALSAPVVTYADGWTVGGGCGLFWSGDLCLAGPAFRFRLAFARLGLGPDMGVSVFAKGRLGRVGFQRLYLRDPTLGPHDARQLGITDNEGPATCTLDEAVERATRLSESAPRAGARAFRQPGLTAALAVEAVRQSRLGVGLRPEDLGSRPSAPAGSAIPQED